LEAETEKGGTDKILPVRQTLQQNAAEMFLKQEMAGKPRVVLPGSGCPGLKPGAGRSIRVSLN